MSETSAGGIAAGGTGRARRAFRLFLAVAVVCVAQVSWWMTQQVRQTDQLAELRRAQLDLRSTQIALQLNDQVSALWEDFDNMAKDSTWKGAIPRQLMDHPLVLSHNRFPTVTRRVQSPFGQYDMDNWTWIFRGQHDTLWVTLDPTAVSRVVESIDPGFEFRGEAPFPGTLPYPLDPLPVRPTVAQLDLVESDCRRELLIQGSEAVIFLLLTVGAAYLIYRSVPRTA